jgi:4-amino-4-deoxy-L-arabinose transferase-like glycosyltransferase
MIYKLKNPRIRLGILAVIANAAILFGLLPEIDSHLHPAYSQDIYADGYDQLAENLAAGNGYRFYPETSKTLMREPGYPLVLAAILLAVGKSFAAVKAVNMALALVTAWLMMDIARRVTNNQALILAPPLLFLFHPGTLVAENRGGVEILFTFLIVLFMAALYRAMESRNWWFYAASGAALGLAVQVKSTPILFPLFLLVYLLIVERKEKLANCSRIALIVIAMFAVLSPWIVRNYSLTGRIIPTASVFGVSAQAGQYICTHRTENKPFWLLDREAALERGRLAREAGYHMKTDDFYYQTFYSTSDELSFSSYLSKRVFDEYRSSPLLCLKCMGSNLFYFWSEGKTEESTVANSLVQLPYIILGIAGIVLSLRNGQFKVIGPLVLFIAYVMSVHVPILAQARYSIPLIPFVSILAGVALAAILGKVSDFGAQQPAIAGVGTGTNRGPSGIGLVRPKESR